MAKVIRRNLIHTVHYETRVLTYGGIWFILCIMRPESSQLCVLNCLVTILCLSWWRWVQKRRVKSLIASKNNYNLNSVCIHVYQTCAALVQFCLEAQFSLETRNLILKKKGFKLEEREEGGGGGRGGGGSGGDNHTFLCYCLEVKGFSCSDITLTFTGFSKNFTCVENDRFILRDVSYKESAVLNANIIYHNYVYSLCKFTNSLVHYSFNNVLTSYFLVSLFIISS